MYENMMGWLVTVPEDFCGYVAAELNKRGGILIDMNIDKGLVTIEADAPFEWMVDFEYWLGKISKGSGTVIMTAARG